MEGDVRL